MIQHRPISVREAVEAAVGLLGLDCVPQSSDGRRAADIARHLELIAWAGRHAADGDPSWHDVAEHATPGAACHSSVMSRCRRLRERLDADELARWRDRVRIAAMAARSEAIPARTADPDVDRTRELVARLAEELGNYFRYSCPDLKRSMDVIADAARKDGGT